MGGPAPKRPPRTPDRLRLRGGLLGWGDSEMGGSGAGWRYFDLACALNNQRPRFAGNYGIGGQTVAQLSTVMQANVLDRNPGIVLFQMATNDLGAGRTAAAILPDYRTEVMRAVNHGIEPIVAAVPPRIGTSAVTREGMRLNAALRDMAADNGWLFLDPWVGLRDLLTNAWATGVSDGSAHPTWVGCKVAAANVAAQLAAWFPPGGVYLADAGGATLDVSPLNDPSFVGAVSNGLSTAWATSGSGGTVVFSRVAEDGATGRNWQRFDVQAAPSSRVITQTVNGAFWAVGDEIEFSIRMKATGYNAGTDAGRAYVRIDCIGGNPSTVYLYNQLPMDFGDSTWTMRFTVPAGTTGVQINIGWISGTWTLDVMRPTWIDRTKEGIA